MTMVAFGTVPKVRFQLAVDAGNVFEAANEIWLADLTGSMLEEGTAVATADALASELAEMGGELAISVGPDRPTSRPKCWPSAARRRSSPCRRGPAAAAARIGAGAREGHARPRPRDPEGHATSARDASNSPRLMYGDHPYGRPFPPRRC